MRQRPVPLLMLCVILLALPVGGCVGIRPAVQPPPPLPDVKPEPGPQAEVVQADTTETQEEIPETAELPEIETVEENAVEEPPPVDDNLDLPATALPPQPAGLAPVAFLPSEGPAPKGDEPPVIGDGWRVQVASVTEQSAAKEIEKDVRAKTDSTISTRWRGDRYTLLVGNFLTEADANVLRDHLRSNGYEGAFVVKAPVVMKKGEGEPVAGQAGTSEPRMAEGWRVQVMSLGTQLDAERAAKQVASKTGFPAYVAESAGRFKVQVGNYVTREDAVKARGKLLDAGYEGAFPVATRIILP